MALSWIFQNEWNNEINTVITIVDIFTEVIMQTIILLSFPASCLSSWLCLFLSKHYSITLIYQDSPTHSIIRFLFLHVIFQKAVVFFVLCYALSKEKHLKKQEYFLISLITLWKPVVLFFHKTDFILFIDQLIKIIHL